jgi:hypothetical protein
MVYFLLVNLLQCNFFQHLGGTSSGSIAPGNADNSKMDLIQIIMDFGEMV